MYFFATAVVFTSCETSNVRISSSLYLQSCFHDFIIVNMLYTNRYIVNIWNFRLLKGILWLYYYTIFKVFFSIFYCREYTASELERCPCVCVCVCVCARTCVHVCVRRESSSHTYQIVGLCTMDGLCECLRLAFSHLTEWERWSEWCCQHSRCNRADTHTHTHTWGFLFVYCRLLNQAVAFWWDEQLRFHLDEVQGLSQISAVTLDPLNTAAPLRGVSSSAAETRFIRTKRQHMFSSWLSACSR